MNRQKEPHLKYLLEAVPHGFIVDSKWLKAQNISRQLVSQYVKRGWLERITHGVYRRPEQLPNESTIDFHDWETVVLSMQRIMGYDVHVGGTTALRRRGHGHYISMGNIETVFLYGAQIPNWIKSIPAKSNFEIRNLKLFTNSRIGIDEGRTIDQSPYTSPPWRWPMTLSSPERAILEAIDELPEKESFHNLDMVFQGLVNLRPRLVTELLKSCTSIKVKRLFFVFADHHNQAWRKHICAQDINLGTGDRAFVKGGRLHPRYRITIPEEFMPRKERAADEY